MNAIEFKSNKWYSKTEIDLSTSSESESSVNNNINDNLSENNIFLNQITSENSKKNLENSNNKQKFNVNLKFKKFFFFFNFFTLQFFFWRCSRTYTTKF